MNPFEILLPESMRSVYQRLQFAPAVKTDDRILCSGVIGVGLDGLPIAEPQAQFLQVFESIKALLAMADATWADVLEVTSYHVDFRQHLPTFVAVKEQFVPAPYPAWTAVGVAELALPGALVEVKVTARVPAKNAVATLAKAVAAASTTDTLEVRVERIDTEAQDISTFELRRPDGAALPAFEPGAHLDVHLPGGLMRQYSLCNPSHETQRYVIAVLRDPASRGGSEALHARVKAGDTLRISAPRNHFPLDTTAGHSILFAGGIGVTPLKSMAERLWREQASFELHYCSRTPARTAFLDELRRGDLARWVQFHFDDGDVRQRLDIAATLSRRDDETHLYICGPQGFMDAVLGEARKQGWPEARLHFEYFGHQVVNSADDQSFEVEVPSRGLKVRVPADRTIAAVLLEHGMPVLMSCEQGVCGTCATRVLSGQPDHRDVYLSDDERDADDQIMVCCSRSKSPRLVLEPF